MMHWRNKGGGYMPKVMKVHYFNVYLTDKYWTWIDEFWSASEYGLNVGDIQIYQAGELYNKAVRLKRMT